ncbi:hypothetical protein ES703_31919 [subsurface metagenome]
MAYLVYWHKMANSGLWKRENWNDALRLAEELAKQEGVFEVQIIKGEIVATPKAPSEGT